MHQPSQKLGGDSKGPETNETSLGLVRDTVAYGIQSVLPQILSLVLLPLFTALLTPEDYATVNLCAVFSLLVAGFASLQLPSILGRFYFDCDQSEISAMFSTILYSTVVVVGIVTALVVAAGDYLLAIVYPETAAAGVTFFPLFFFSLISTGITLIASCCYLLLQVEREARLVLRISAVVALCHFLTSVLFVVVFRWGPKGVLGAGVVSALISLGMVLFAVRKHIVFSYQTKHVAPGLKYCLPLMPHFYGGFLFVSSDIIILEKYVTLAAVGLYAVAVKLSSPLSIFVEAFNRSISPQFMKMSKQSKTHAVAQFRELISKWFSVALFLWIGFCLFAWEAVTLITPASFHGATIFLPILSAAYVFRGLYCFAVNGLFYEKKTNWIPVITVIAGIANVVLNIYLVPKFGVIAAAWTTLFSYALSFILAVCIARFFYPLSWDIPRLVFMGLLALVIVITTNWISIDSSLTRVAFKTLLCAVTAVVLGFAGKTITLASVKNAAGQFQIFATKTGN